MWLTDSQPQQDIYPAELQEEVSQSVTYMDFQLLKNRCQLKQACQMKDPSARSWASLNGYS
jgi:hypothetical protein